MDDDSHQPLVFKSRRLTAHFIDPAGTPMERSIEVRTHPISGRSCRITYSRIHEKEAGAETLPPPPIQKTVPFVPASVSAVLPD